MTLKRVAEVGVARRLLSLSACVQDSRLNILRNMRRRAASLLGCSYENVVYLANVDVETERIESANVLSRSYASFIF